VTVFVISEDSVSCEYLPCPEPRSLQLKFSTGTPLCELRSVASVTAATAGLTPPSDDALELPATCRVVQRGIIRIAHPDYPPNHFMLPLKISGNATNCFHLPG
jgi:hypothetical protein